jgi:hypothetical protein
MSGTPDTTSTPEQIEKATAQGWRNEPREGFKTAAEFIEFGEKVGPIQRERNSHLANEIAELKRQNAEMTSVFFKAQHEAKIEGYKKAKAELLEKQATAFENADEATFKRTAAALEKLEPPAAIAPTPAKQAASVDPAFVDWQASNVWYGSDRVMSAAADAIGKEVSDSTSLVGASFYKEVERRVKEEFPHKFGNQNRRQPNSVEGGPPPADTKTGKKDFASLPADVKAGADSVMKSFGIYKTKEDYAKAYWRESEKNGWA